MEIFRVCSSMGIQGIKMIFTDKYKLYCGDCLKVLPRLKCKVHLVICDPPYGNTPLNWDTNIDFSKLWNAYNHVCKDNAAILIFGNEPFSSYLRLSNVKDYKYDWYWEKERLTNVFQVKHRCGKTVETISVFYSKQCIYNPQKTIYTGKPVSNKIGENAIFSKTQGGTIYNKPIEYIDDGTRHPTQVLRFNRENNRYLLHPTQKPVKLLEYLIKTYSNENSIVLDNCMGSGSTGIACLTTGRRFIGIEKDPNFFKIASERIENKYKEMK